MPQTTVLPQWRADYPILTPAQKPSGIIKDVSRTATAGAWAAGKITLTFPALADVVGTIYPMTIAGFTPAGYNGTVNGTIASATTVTYPAADPGGVATVFGTAKYRTVVANTILTTLSPDDVPNRAPYAAGTIQLAEAEPEELPAEAASESAPEAAPAAAVEEPEEEVEEEADEEEEEKPPRKPRSRR